VGCRRARAVARASQPFSAAHPGRYRARGFSCRGVAVEGAVPTALYTCRDGRATIAFTRT
jgi:hypothetical protein